jgi:hypothetical protein
VSGKLRAQREREIIRWQGWRKNLASDSWGVKILRLTAIVWVPVVGLGTIMGLKILAGWVIRMLIAGFTWILRAIFH